MGCDRHRLVVLDQTRPNPSFVSGGKCQPRAVGEVATEAVAGVEGMASARGSAPS